MASFTPNRIDLTAINNGKRYEDGDFPTPETFNAPIEAAAFAQNIATNNESQISSLKSKVEKHSDQISRNTKAIENLDSQLNPDLIVFDKQIAYAKEVPIRSAPYAEITKFGGMSYVVEGTFRHAKPTAFKSIGQNYIPFPYEFEKINESGFEVVIDSEQRLIVNGAVGIDRYYTLKEFHLPVGTYYLSAIQTSEISRVYFYKNGEVFWSQAKTDPEFRQFEVTSASDTYKVQLVVNPSTYNNEVVAPMISKDVASSYKPYKESTLAISPAVLERCDGYGYGVNANAYNYVDWVDKKYHKVLSTANIGSYDWLFGGYYAYPNVSNFAKPYGACIANVPSKITNYYINDSGVPVFIFNDGDYANADEVKSAMQGVMLLYELATPEVIDIPNLPDDNLIAVEGGGTIIAENKYDYAIPSEITYQLRRAT